MVQGPPRDVIEAWVVYLRGGRTALEGYVANPSTFVAQQAQYDIVAKGSSIQTYLLGAQHINDLVADGLNLTGDERPRSLLDGGFLKQLKGYRADDTFTGHKAFDPVEVLRKLYHAICLKKWPASKKLRVWAQLLLQMVLIGRASCVTEHCPRMETVELPPQEAAKLWSPREGRMPQFLTVYMTSRKNTELWKNLTDRQKGKGFVIYRNHLDAMVDPVYWLLQWLDYLYSQGISEGPLFPREGARGALLPGTYMVAEQWERVLDDLFRAVRRSVHCTRLIAPE